jgi:PAS domain S-box-containing protein
MHPTTDKPLPSRQQNFIYLEELIQGQGLIMEMISGGRDLPEILEAIVRWAEKESNEGLMASILLLDKEGKRLVHGAAPSLPEEYNQAIHGVEIGPSVGSCGTAAYTKTRVIVDDIEKDPLWKDYKDLALKFNLRACWSTPLIGRNDTVLGTFAMYYEHPNKPGSQDLDNIRLITSTTVLALEWKKAEEERTQLLENEKRVNDKIKGERQNFYQLLMQAPALVAILKGSDHVYELANNLYGEAVGTERMIIGKPIREALPELKGQGIFELLDNVFNTGEPFYGNEIPVRVAKAKDILEEIYFNFTYHPIRNENAEVEGIFVHAVDVTELVKAKKRAEQSEEMFRSFVLNSPMPIGIYIGREMRIQTVNDAILKAWEKDLSVKGKTFREALPELEGQPFYQLLDEVYTTGKTYQATEDRVDLMRDGKITPTYWNFTYKALRNEDGEIYGVMNTAAEVTELVKAKQKLGEARETLRSAIDIAELGTWSIDIGSNTVTYSKPIADWFNLPSDKCQMDEVFKSIDETDRDKVERAVEQALSSSGIYEAEYRVKEDKNGVSRILHAKGKVIVDENGKQVALNGVCRDITLQKETEKELEKQVEIRTLELQRANAELNSLNENLKQFVYIASHDLQEPLRKINMFSDMLRLQVGESISANSQNYLNKIMQASKRMATLIKDLLDFSRAEASSRSFVPTNLNQVLQNVIEDYEMLIQQKNAVVDSSQLPVIEAIPLQMNQLFYNLLGNALKFSRGNLSPVITIRSSPLTPAEKEERRLNRNWEYTDISISDNGIGFDQKFAEQIFIIFQRLHMKEEFEGTGIGLALCKKIADNHNGLIYAEGAEGEGATFHIILPVARS